MGSFKVGDRFYGHPAIVGIPLRAVGAWVLAGSWAVKYDTNGDVPRAVLRMLGVSSRDERTLIKADLWRPTDNGVHFVNWRKHQDGDYRRNIRRRVREEVLERDGHKCVECDATENLSLDHIVRYRDDGPDTADNLRVLCMPCNLRRG